MLCQVNTSLIYVQILSNKHDSQEVAPAMNIEYIDSYIAAVRKVISTMAFMDTEAGHPRIKDEKDHSSFGVVSAVIELMGENRGSLAISFPETSVLKIAASVFAEDFASVNEDVVDLVGELINMISGETRRRLSKFGYQFSAGIPVTLDDNDHEIKHFVESKVILIPFTSKAGEFFAEASFDFPD